MKFFIAAILLLVILCGFVGVHSYMMIDMSKDISKICNRVDSLADSEKWEEVIKELDKIEKIWDKKRIWTSLTIETKNIEQIEIAFRQSMAYARLGEKSDFVGEFTMFAMLVNHIPHQEGFHIEEIL